MGKLEGKVAFITGAAGAARGVNSVHPASVDTDMIHNKGTYAGRRRAGARRGLLRAVCAASRRRPARHDRAVGQPAALQTHSMASPALQKLNADLDGKLAAPLDVVVL